MGTELSKTDKKVHFRDSTSRDIMFTYKRRRRQQQEEEPSQAQARTQPEPQQQEPPQAQVRAKTKPQQQLQPQEPAQSEPQTRLEPNHKAGDAPAQESKDTFWKSRDMAWKYGIMIDENRQHWKCTYCGVIRYGGGVSRLKRHLAGDLDVKMCPKVPANVAEEIRVHLREKREGRRKRAAQNGGNNIKTKSSSDDGIVGKDNLPADLVVPPPETDINVFEEVTNQTSAVHQDATCPKVPLLRTRDIGWEHAVDLDGNKRRWQCKFCSLCRSGGVTTLKAHLIDGSCPNVPKEISKKVSNFIQEKRAMRLLFNKFAFSVDDDQVSDSQIQEEGTVHCEDNQQPSTSSTHKCATNEVSDVANRSSQRSAESNGQSIEDCDQTEEQRAMDHGRIHQMASNKHLISNKSIKDSKNTKTLESRLKRGFSTRKHIVIVDASAGHWRCRYCGMDGYGKKFRLHYHLAGAFRQPKCPNAPKEVFAKARHYVKIKKSLKRVKSGKQIPSGPHIVGQSGEGLQTINPLCGNHNQLLVNDESNEHGPSSLLEVRKDVTEKIRNQLISKDEQRPRRSESFDRNGDCSSKSSQFDEEDFTTTMNIRNSPEDFEHTNVKSGACNTLSNPLQESVNPEQKEEDADAGDCPLMFHEQHREESGASPPVVIEQQRDEAASPSEPGCLQGQRMQCLLQQGANRSSQRSVESNGQSVEHCDQTEEQWAMDHFRIHQIASNKHLISNRSIKNSKNTKTSESRLKRGFSTRKHIVIVDASAGHWRCRYCGMDGYGKKFRLHYHIAGAFHQPKCPNAPKEVIAKSRHYVRTKKGLKRVKSGKLIPSVPHIVGQSDEELQSSNPLYGNHNQLPVNDESNEHYLSSHLGVQKDATEKISNQLISKDEQRPRRSESFDGNGDCSSKSSQFDQEHFTTTRHIRNFSEDFEHTNGKSVACNTLSNPSQESVNPEQKKQDADAGDSPLMFHEQHREESGASPPVVHEQQRDEAASPSEPGCLQGQRMQWLLQHNPITEEGSHANRFFGNTNKSEKQRSDYWTNCWRNVLSGLMHSSDIQEGAGIWTCIRDALLYGCAQLGTVPHTVELANGTVNVNTSKCQNVFMDILRSEDFVLLCNVLCRAVHQEGSRTRYFDFGLIDSRMKNGNYGHEPTLFMHDLKLVWEDLKMSGQNIVELANNLSSLTEASCGNLVEREKETSETELKGAVASSSGPINFVESNALVISTSDCVNQLHQSDRVDLEQSGPVDIDQSDPVHVSDIQDSTCNQCGKEAREGSVVTCTKCLLSWHISCTESPPVPSISTESWYCGNCRMDKSIEGDMVLAHYQPKGVHENCVVCDRLEVCSPPKCKDTPNDNSTAMVLYNVGAEEDSELPEIDTVGSCKICGKPEEEDKRFLICGHVHCPYKYYHICCLQSKQIASDFQRDKPCWYCPSCLCRVCLSDKDDDLTILCDGCDEAYHLYCIRPRRTSIPKGQWYCSTCCAKRAKDGIRRYERRMLKLHRKVDTTLQRKKFDGVDLLLSAADRLRADE